MKTKLFVLIFTVLLLHCSYSQNKWSILFGTEKFTGLTQKNLPEDLPKRIVENKFGDYYITGTNSLNNGDANPNTIGSWIAKFSKTGKLEWWKHGYKDIYGFAPHLITCTPDGGVIVSGSSSGGSEGFGDDGISMFRFSKEGELLWRKDFDTKKICVNSVCGEQGGLAVNLWTQENGQIDMVVEYTIRKPHEKDGMIINDLVKIYSKLEFNSEGEHLATKKIDAEYIYCIHKVIPAKNGFYLLQFKESDVEIRFFNNNAELQWFKKQTAKSTVEYATGFIGNSEHLIVSYFYGSGKSSRCYMFELDNNGELMKNIDLGNLDIIVSIFPDGNNYVLGYQGTTVDWKMTYCKIDENGKTLWKKTFGTSKTMLIDGVESSDNGLVWVGYTNEFGSNFTDVLLIKTDENGNAEMVPKKYSNATDK